MKKEKEEGPAMIVVSRGRRADAGKKRAVDGSVEKAIGSRLRAYYDEVAREPVPDRFVTLLKRLDDESNKH
jgi:Anti-sigma factor NepR